MSAKPVLLDCDPGIDDALALLHLGGIGGKLLGVASVHGNVPATTAAENAVRILDVMDMNDVPVWTGAARPMAQPLLTAEHVHGPDGLGGTNSGALPRPVSDGIGAVKIVEMAHAHPGEFTLVAVGPLTNLGLALLLEPNLPDLIPEVMIMGGAMLPPGNVTENAEANTWHDPEASQLVIEAAWQKTFVTLDATMQTVLSDEQLGQLANSDNPRAKYAWSILQFYLDAYEQWLGRKSCPLHDPLAMALAFDPALASYVTYPTRVELRGEATRGSLVPDLRGIANPETSDASGDVRYVDELDVERFQAKFLESLTSDSLQRG